MYINKTKVGALLSALALLSGCATNQARVLVEEVKLIPKAEMASREANEWVTSGMVDVGERIQTVMDTAGYYVYENLEEASGSDRIKVNAVIKEVNYALSTRSISNGCMGQEQLDYILYLMDNLGKYVYEVGQVELVGIDNNTKRYVVDVEYNAVPFELKTEFIKPDIVRGEPLEEVKKEVKLKRYLEDVYGDGTKNSAWGVHDGSQPVYSYEVGVVQTPYEVREGYYGYGSVQRVIECVDTTKSKLKFRYIFALSPITLNLALESAYLLDYTSGDILLDSVDSDLFTDNTKKSLDGFVENYYKSLNTRNFTGLYNLMFDSGRYERFNYQMFNNIYAVHTTAIEDYYRREGDTINLILASELKLKAKDKDISYGVYSKRDIATIKWESGGFKLVDIETLDIKLKKEPSLFRAEENLYILEEYELTSKEQNEQSKQQVEVALAELSSTQTNSGNTSITSYIDSTKSLIEIEKIRSGLVSFSADAKYTFIEDWVYATSLTCDVKLNEYYLNDEGQSHNVVSRIKYEKMGGKWFITDYIQTFTEEVDNDFGTDYFNTSIEKRIKIGKD